MAEKEQITIGRVKLKVKSYKKKEEIYFVVPFHIGTIYHAAMTDKNI